MTTPTPFDRVRGSLLGGAVGDALGAAVEFLSLSEIRERFGVAGVRDYAHAYGRRGAITDDTQMTLFTAEGVLRAWVRAEERGICVALLLNVGPAVMANFGPPPSLNLGSPRHDRGAIHGLES